MNVKSSFNTFSLSSFNNQNSESSDLFGSDNEDYVKTQVYSKIPKPHLPPSQQNRKRPHNDDSNIPQKRPRTELVRNPQAEKNDRQGVGFGSQTYHPFQRKKAAVSSEVFTHTQTPKFLQSAPSGQYDDDNNSNMREDEDYYTAGLKISSKEDESNIATFSRYCDESFVQSLFESKSQFDGMDEKRFAAARSASNPYEKIGKSIFYNKGAIKMANIDHLYELTLVSLLAEENGVLYFGDICGGPGGFTEYVYWRKKTIGAKGWGMSLKVKDDWRLDKFNPESPHDNFDILNGEDGTGDITKNQNIKSFAKNIDQGTSQRGLALLMADGAFSVVGDENNQEILTKQLILCQIITALVSLRKGGYFVCKLFDTFTPFTVGLLYILYRNFNRISILKPLASRPANSERYIVCLGLKQKSPPIIEYLFSVNDKINQLNAIQNQNPNDPNNKSNANTKSVVELILPEVMDNDEKFMDYISTSNMDIVCRQLKFLKEIKKYVDDPNLPPADHSDVRRRCLQEWGMPFKNPTIPSMPNNSVPAYMQPAEMQPMHDMRFPPGGNRNQGLPQQQQHMGLQSSGNFSPNYHRPGMKPVVQSQPKTGTQDLQDARTKHSNNDTYSLSSWKTNKQSTNKASSSSSAAQNKTKLQQQQLDLEQAYLQSANNKPKTK